MTKNIIWGDALDLKTIAPDPQPIIFAEWSFPFNNSQVKRRDYVFAALIPEENQKQQNLFAQNVHSSDLGEKNFIPKETRSYPLIHFLKIGETYD